MEATTPRHHYYDLIYHWKDYTAEVAVVEKIVKEHSKRNPKSLIDIACGTGKHLELFKDKFDVVEGVDLDESGNLAAARARLPGVALHVGNMIDFSLSRTFDVVTCLFSSIGYVRTVANLNATIANLAKHLNEGGILIVEPWLTPTAFIPGTITSNYVDKPDMKICRMCVSQARDGVSILDFHFMIATRSGVERFNTLHELGLFTHEEYIAAFNAAQLQVIHDSQGFGRGLYIGLK